MNNQIQADLSSEPQTLPEQGQLVEVRQRRYVVNDVLASQQVGVLDGVLGTAPPPQHLVTLTSIEDDALGEELQVIWELEPGTRVFAQAQLPEPTSPHCLDTPERLDAFLNAVRWGASVSADGRTLQAPFRSGIDIEDYQFE